MSSAIILYPLAHGLLQTWAKY